MGLGDIMTGKVRDAMANGGAVTDPADTKFYDEEVKETKTEATSALTPVGKVTRPNGASYTPRSIGKHEDLALIRFFRDNKEHTLFYGPPGTGKTAMAEAAFAQDATAVVARPTKAEQARAAANEQTAKADVYGGHLGVESIVCSADTTEADFMGTWVQDPNSGQYVWAPGPLHRAVMNNVPLYVDEIFLADPRVLSSVLYPVMDGRDVLRISANPTLAPLPVGDKFFVIGSGNPDVAGAQFSDALRDRFTHHIEVNTDWVLAKDLGVPAKLIQVSKNLDQKRINGIIGWSPQLRTLLSFVQASKQLDEEFALQGLLGKAPFADRAIIKEALDAVLGTKVQHLALGSRHGKK